MSEAGLNQLDALEQRRYMSSFVYEGYDALAAFNNPRTISQNTYGPVAVVADVDDDGHRDLLIGNAGYWVAGRGAGELSGAGVYSGRDGSLLRSHNIGGYHNGWSVADIGDTDGDGVSDYAVSGGAEGHAVLFSGATGDALLTLHPSATRRDAWLSAAGDVDGDGRADILMGLPDQGRGAAFSGATGEELFSLTVPGLTTHIGIGATGGADLDGDGVPDFVISGWTENPRELSVYAFSGADGSHLWTRATGISTQSNPGVPFTVSLLPDFSGDGLADLAYTREQHIIILSGADGTVAHDFTPHATWLLRSDVIAIGDVNGDSIQDLAVASSNIPSDAETAIGGGLLVASGADGSMLSILRALNDSSYPYFRPSFGADLVGRDIAAADIDGDGAIDIAAVAKLFSGYMTPGYGTSFVFDGANGFIPTVSGLTSGPASRTIVWGESSGHAFIIRDGVISVLSDAPMFAEGETITDVHETETKIHILGKDVNGGAFLWVADHNLTGVSRSNLDSLVEVGGPEGQYTDMRAIGVIGTHVLVQRTLDGGTPTAWLADASAGGQTLTYLFLGTPIDFTLNSNQPPTISVVGLFPEGGEAGLLWRNGVISEIQGTPLFIAPQDAYALVRRAAQGGSGLVLAGIDVGAEDIVIPGIDGGEDFQPTGINRYAEVVGTYRITATGQRSGFFFHHPEVGLPPVTADIRSEQVFGDPEWYATTGVDALIGATQTGDVLVRQGSSYALVSLASNNAAGVGPARAADDAPISVIYGAHGAVWVLTLNEAQEVIQLADIGHGWGGGDFPEAPRPFTGELLQWFDTDVSGAQRRVLAFATSEGLITLTETFENHTFRWAMRNLTAEIAGAEPIVDGLTTLVPHNGLRLVGGLTASGELVLYGQTAQLNPDNTRRWAYDNLYNSVVEPTNTPPPDFRVYSSNGKANLVSYVTGWDGLNIAGIADGGQIVVFWTAPGITGWRITNLAQVSQGTDGGGAASSYFQTLSVALTPWNGINLYGETPWRSVQVLWWVPEFGPDWRADVFLSGANGNEYQQGSLTAYAHPWGGLNVARLTTSGDVEVYWWSPASNGWQHELIDEQVSNDTSYLTTFRPTGRLVSAVSSTGVTSIFARNELGDIFRFYWSPGQSWELERI